MAIENFEGKNIQDTFQRVVQTDSTNQLADGTGSIFIPVSSSHAITASHALFAVSASHEITFEISSSHAVNADTASFATNFTASGNISASGAITANRFDIGGDKFAAIGSPGTFDIGQTGQASLNLTHITASGEISASENILGGSIRASSGFVGTINTIAQPNITSVGTLTGLNVNGNITASGNISASGDLTVNNINGTIDGGTF